VRSSVAIIEFLLEGSAAERGNADVNKGERGLGRLDEGESLRIYPLRRCRCGAR
jgi:hypothetical protein